jgi:hypothetical protein
VTLPAPEPGLVIRYSYLWLREYEQGREEGVKDRPCAIILALVDADGDTRVTVLSVTHSAPGGPSTTIEIPRDTKRRLGLDSERSWIILAEANEFVWPGPDLRPIPGADMATVAYGFLPPRFFNLVRQRFLALARQRRTQGVQRTE